MKKEDLLKGIEFGEQLIKDSKENNIPIPASTYERLISLYRQLVNAKEFERVVYRAKFNLVNPVKDYWKARAYLVEDDMTKYLLGDSRGCSKVIHVEWVLLSSDEGYIEVTTNGELTEEESANISSWISGQCSDGLGEGFEQQDFACYEYGDDDYEDDCYYGECTMASFDWQTNDYTLVKMTD